MTGHARQLCRGRKALDVSANFREDYRGKHISHAALIQQINTLEDALGFTLFIRSPKGIRLTESGAYFEKKPREIDLQIEQLVRSCIELEQKNTFIRISNPKHACKSGSGASRWKLTVVMQHSAGGLAYNLKTASGIFPASVLTFDHEPAYAQDLLVYDGKYYVIGSGHREFTPDKVSNPDHYILTRAGIGQELWKNRMTETRVYIAAGLPLTWVESQRESFRAYLLQNDHVDFIWRGIEYHVDIVGADVYAQGFSAIVPIEQEYEPAFIRQLAPMQGRFCRK